MASEDTDHRSSSCDYGGDRRSYADSGSSPDVFRAVLRPPTETVEQAVPDGSDATEKAQRPAGRNAPRKRGRGKQQVKKPQWNSDKHWACPNPNCGFKTNFASKTKCYRCWQERDSCGEGAGGVATPA